MTQCDGRRNVGILAEISVDELHIGTAHSAGPHVDENFVRLDIGNRYVLEDQGLAVLVHACCFHISFPFRVAGLGFKRSVGNGRAGYGSSKLSNSFTPRSVALRPLAGLVPVTTRPEVIE